MAKCDCVGCQRNRAERNENQPCYNVPPPTVEYVKTGYPESFRYLAFPPLWIFTFSCGMAVGKYFL